MEKSERPEQNQDLRCQSGPSAKNSVLFSGGDSSKNYGADQQRLQISDLHFDKFPTPATFACWKIRFKTEECSCSQFPWEATQWITKVELVESVDELNFVICLLLLSTSCTPSCTLSSTTRSSWKACATPPTRGVTTPTTSPPPSHTSNRERDGETR